MASQTDSASTMGRVALVTGVTGQDGSYMAEHLLAHGYRVVGAVRDPLRARGVLPAHLAERVELIAWDLRSVDALAQVLAACRPMEVYNFAAYSSGEGMFDDAVDIGDVNGLAVARLLEAIRVTDTGIRLCQASSSEMFGLPLCSPQTEASVFRPRSPYGAAKLYAHGMIDVYRRRYGLFACSAILYNHESPRRGVRFVTRKVSRAAASIKLGLAHELRLGALDARRDWGFAGDYVRAMRLMVNQPGPDDYVIATGTTHSVRDLCEVAFQHVDLDWKRYVREDQSALRPAESVELVGNASKAREVLNWEPRVGFEELIRMMVDADLQALRTTAQRRDEKVQS